MNAGGLRRVAATLGLVACLSEVVEAQPVGSSPLAVGERVRFKTTTGEVTRRAVILEISDTGLLVESREGERASKPALRVSFEDIASLEVARGRRSMWGEGTTWGALLGAGAGMLFVAANGGLDGGCEGPCGGYFLVSGAAGALAGATLGALVGVAIRTDRFEPVKLDRVRVGLRPSRRGLGASLTLSF